MEPSGENWTPCTQLRLILCMFARWGLTRTWYLSVQHGAVFHVVVDEVCGAHHPGLASDLYLGPVLLGQEVQLQVVEVVEVGPLVAVPEQQGLVDKVLQDVLYLLGLQHLEAGVHGLVKCRWVPSSNEPRFPLVVSLVGALLREFPDRWAYYLQLLQRKQFRRIRKSSSYDYDALDQAMDASFQVLPKEEQHAVFSVETAELLLEISSSRLSTVQYIHACPVTGLLAIALSHYTVELWDLESNKKMADLSGHLSWVHGVQFSPDGSMLLSCSDDHTVRMTRVPSGDQVVHLTWTSTSSLSGNRAFTSKDFHSAVYHKAVYCVPLQSCTMLRACSGSFCRGTLTYSARISSALSSSMPLSTSTSCRMPAQEHDHDTSTEPSQPRDS
ncbi:LOW QUALITY PROTEIN: hypothetical protein CRUP_026257 [Coryphaenoides rupestris]|nr:LOW QUALITY PROTEIN: hypothetical protein CRUP_026257 [Coryphaenoides rupestris]